MKIDQNFDKILEDYVTKNKRRTLCLTIRGTQAVISGEENCVDLANENIENMTVCELIEAMKLMDNEDEENMRYKTTEVVVFPPFKAKFKGRLWTLQRARNQLCIIMNSLGFGKGGPKKFTVAADEPEGWPDEYSFETLQHPSYANMKMVNDVIEAILIHHGVDAKSHPFEADEPPTPEKPTKRKAAEQRRMVLEGEDDPNDNSLNEEEVAGPSNRLSKKRKLSQYEQIREDNIQERQNLERELIILPHSKDSG